MSIDETISSPGGSPDMYLSSQPSRTSHGSAVDIAIDGTASEWNAAIRNSTSDTAGGRYALRPVPWFTSICSP